MTIQALISGKLIADPERRTSSNGKLFTLARIVAHDGDGDALVSAIAFGSVAEQLAALGKGDAVAVSGRAKVTTWSGRDGNSKAGLSVTVDALLTTYHLRHRRAAMAGADTLDGADNHTHYDSE